MFSKGVGCLLKSQNGHALNELGNKVVWAFSMTLTMVVATQKHTHTHTYGHFQAHINPSVSFEIAKLQRQLYFQLYVCLYVCVCEHPTFSVFSLLRRLFDLMCRPMVRVAIIT